MYLSDLIYVDEGNPDSFENGLINFDKQVLVYESLREIIMYQNRKHSFEKSDSLYYLLASIPFFDGDTLYELSVAKEPRKQMD